MTKEVPEGPTAHDIEVDVLVVGSGTGLAAAIATEEQGLSTLVIEKSKYVGGSTALSGGGIWIPANPTLLAEGSADTLGLAREYIDSVVGDAAPRARWEAFLKNGPETVRWLHDATPLELFWAKGYSDYHPENPGGAAAGRTVEAKPFDTAKLGGELDRLQPSAMAAPVPMPITGADYKWMNLMLKKPVKALPRIIQRVLQGIGGKAISREYAAGGQALAAGLFAGAIEAGVPIWTNCELVSLIEEDGRVVGAIAKQGDKEVTIRASRGVILAAGGFDHNMEMRREHQSPSLVEDLSLGAETNTGDAINAAVEAGADTAFMEQSWWFPAVAPLAEGEAPMVLLAERSLPGSLMVDQHAKRFINEATDYMTFGQKVLEREKSGDPVEEMWLVFDKEYSDSYVFAGSVFPMMELPESFYEAGIAVKADNPRELAEKAGLDPDAFDETMYRYNHLAGLGVDGDFHRGDSAYDRYYGDPTQQPNPNLRPLKGKLFAVKVVLSDLGTCGGVKANEHGQALDIEGTPIPGLYVVGNNAGNVFGNRYPGAGATIGQGLVFSKIAADHIAAS